ncbi:MAG TPA: PRC-barrel domain-containing protein [Terriglobales bacterium]|nr:PRC-barrel domain-containing protein [Terriglobales bacterium]
MYGTLRDYRFNKDIDDIRGSAVYGPDDEKLGKIDDVIFDSDNGQIRYLVIDTGGWLKSRRFLVPPNEVRPSAEKNDDFVVNLTKNQIEHFPALDEKVLEDKQKFQDYETTYRSSWTRPYPAGTEVPSQSPLSPRFLTFQDEIVRNRTSICNRPGVTSTREPQRKVG